MRDRSLKSSQPGLLRGMAMDCQLDGLLSQTGPHGFRIDFGRIISWTPPSSLEFLCQVPAHRAPRPDPEQAIMVSVVFDSLADGTRVTVKHHAWERHGAEAQKYRDGFAEAWPMALERFRRHLEQ